MPFGVTGTNAAQISRETNYTAENTMMTNNMGKNVDMTIHGAKMEKSEEFYVTPDNDFENTVVEGATGTSGVTGCKKTESNSDYAKFTVTKVVLPDDPTYE